MLFFPLLLSSLPPSSPSLPPSRFSWSERVFYFDRYASQHFQGGEVVELYHGVLELMSPLFPGAPYFLVDIGAHVGENVEGVLKAFSSKSRGGEEEEDFDLLVGRLRRDEEETCFWEALKRVDSEGGSSLEEKIGNTKEYTQKLWEMHKQNKDENCEKLDYSSFLSFLIELFQNDKPEKSKKNKVFESTLHSKFLKKFQNFEKNFDFYFPNSADFSRKPRTPKSLKNFFFDHLQFFSDSPNKRKRQHSSEKSEFLISSEKVFEKYLDQFGPEISLFPSLAQKQDFSGSNFLDFLLENLSPGSLPLPPEETAPLLAIEAFPRNCEEFRRMAEGLGWLLQPVFLHCVAVPLEVGGGMERWAELMDHEVSDLAGKVVPVSKEEVHGGGEGRLFVPLKSVLQVVRSQGWDPKKLFLLKSDCEGADIPIIQSSLTSGLRPHLIWMEMQPSYLDKLRMGGESQGEQGAGELADRPSFLNWMASRGYPCFLVLPQMIIPIFFEFAAIVKSDAWFSNVMCFKCDSSLAIKVARKLMMATFADGLARYFALSALYDACQIPEEEAELPPLLSRAEAVKEEAERKRTPADTESFLDFEVLQLGRLYFQEKWVEELFYGPAFLRKEAALLAEKFLVENVISFQKYIFFEEMMEKYPHIRRNTNIETALKNRFFSEFSKNIDEKKFFFAHSDDFPAREIVRNADMQQMFSPAFLEYAVRNMSRPASASAPAREEDSAWWDAVDFFLFGLGGPPSRGRALEMIGRGLEDDLLSAHRVADMLRVRGEIGRRKGGD